MTDERQLVEGVLSRDPEACRALIARLTPVIRARVARVLAQHATRRGRPAERQEVLDLVQEIFLVLLDRDGRVLRSWDPERGLSLANFVGLVAEREAGAFLRSGRRSGWAEAPASDEFLANRTQVAGPERGIASKELLVRLTEGLHERLSPRGFALFEALFVEQQDVDTVAERFNMSANALYTFRSRLRREVRELRDELCGTPAHAGEMA